MRSDNTSFTNIAQTSWLNRLLRTINIRPEESERTILMFAFYTATSVGLSWLESSTVALFLGEYGADTLPWIYMASAVIGIALGLLYSWLQAFLPLRRVIVLVALLMAVPLILFRTGLNIPGGPVFLGLSMVGITVLMMRLWLEAIYVLSELNTSITANQLFNIREIKRAFPLINSGILVADVFSGFSMPLMVKLVGLPNVVLLAGCSIAVGAGILLYLSETYRQFFPDTRRRMSEGTEAEVSTTRLQEPIQRYIVLLVAFFVMSQVLYLLIDFQFLSQLESRKVAGIDLVNQMMLGGVAGFIGEKDIASATDAIAGFLGIFQGFLGIFEIVTQWFASSRMIERLGVFVVTLMLPVLVFVLGLFLMTGLVPAFAGFVVLKFLDEWLRYTLLNSSSPVLFQPLPDHVRSNLQASVRGIAEPLSIGLTGVGLLGLLAWRQQERLVGVLQNWILITLVVVTAGLWALVIWLLRVRYVGLLVMGAERGQLSFSNVNLRELKQAVIGALNRPAALEEKRSCIELLSHIDPRNVGEVLAPMLSSLPPALQLQSLEVMMQYPNPAYLSQVRALIDQPLMPEVLARALRYIWLTEPDPDIRQLRPYLRSEVDPVVRGTAASLVLRRGTARQKAEATNTLRQMLTHKRERERVMGCRALGEAVYMQALRLYIPSLLQDESLRVRCALLEAISATQLEEYYPSLLRGLHYKSTREAALNALVRLENEALTTARLVELAEDVQKPELVRLQAWTAIGRIGTQEARNVLVSHLLTAWGTSRRNILKILLDMPQESGINAVLDRLGRTGVEVMIEQELMYMAQLYQALADLMPERIDCLEADLLRRAIQDAIADTTERIFPLMKLLYRAETIKAAAFNLQSSSRSSVARGLEILDNTLDMACKRLLLGVLDRRPDMEKLQSLSELVPYQPMPLAERLRYLVDLRHFLPDWLLSCCFHLAGRARCRLTPDQTLASLRHPAGFVREAVITYLAQVSPRTLKELLPRFQNDPDRLLASQVNQMIQMINQNGHLPSLSTIRYFQAPSLENGQA